jgi:hypothetical protein
LTPQRESNTVDGTNLFCVRTGGFYFSKEKPIRRFRDVMTLLVPPQIEEELCREECASRYRRARRYPVGNAP